MLCVKEIKEKKQSENRFFYFIEFEMDLLTMILIEERLNIPLDVVIFINEWVKYESLNDENIQEAVNLWYENKEECLQIWRYKILEYNKHYKYERIILL